MTADSKSKRDQALPCTHDFPTESIDSTKKLLRELDKSHPELLREAGISADIWPDLLRATIESLRGTASANPREKQKFITATLDHCKAVGAIKEWRAIDQDGRQDYRVELPGGQSIAIEAKGCPDGNNLTIWDRPTWADEFIVWSLCPESLAHPPGRGAWAGVATRLLPKVTADKKIVDAFIFWDGRCGSKMRPCPKKYGVTGELRERATVIEGAEGSKNWLPPPCIYLLPRSAATVPGNPKPQPRTLEQSYFASALLEAFEVPVEHRQQYVHNAEIEARSTAKGLEIQVTAISRCRDDGSDRTVQSKWKHLKREA